MTSRQQQRQHARDVARQGLTATYAANAKVVIATVHPSQVHAQYHDSIVNTLLYDAQSGSGLIGGCISLQSGPRIVASRNMVCEAFLFAPELRVANSDQPFEWLCLIDADMKFPEDAIHCLVARAETFTGADGKPIKILGALCFAGNSLNLYPTIYDLGRDPESGGLTCDPVMEYPKNEVVRVGGTGAAFLIIHRDVLAHMYQHYTREAGAAYPWFEDGVNKDGHEFGEDLTFCVRAGALGYATHVDTRVKIGHMKEIELGEELYEGLGAIEDLNIRMPIGRGKKNNIQRRDTVDDHL